MKYYPISKVKTGLIAKEGEFTLNGKPYIGPYYITYDNKAFTGVNPVLGGNNLLTPLPQSYESPNDYISGKPKLKRSTIEYNAPNFGNFTPYFPSPNSEDYRKGFIIRYFSKKFNDNRITEISKEQHDDFKGPNVNKYDTTLFKVTSMFWQISGPLNDTRKSQYNTIPGVLNTNKRLTVDREREFPGLISYINEKYTEFAIIAPV